MVGEKPTRLATAVWLLLAGSVGIGTHAPAAYNLQQSDCDMEARLSRIGRAGNKVLSLPTELLTLKQFRVASVGREGQKLVQFHCCLVTLLSVELWLGSPDGVRAPGTTSNDSYVVLKSGNATLL